MENESCIDSVLIHACWMKDCFFQQCADLLHVISIPHSFKDVNQRYPSVTATKFSDDLHDSKYKLIDVSSEDISGPLVHMKKGPIKEQK